MKTLIILVSISAIVGIFIGVQYAPQVFGGVPNQLDTSSNTLTHSTSTVTTTSTRFFASVTKLCYVKNESSATIHCSMDAVNTTAGSSTVRSDRGLVIEPASSSNNYASFGECRGEPNCFPHKGALNCVSTATGTVGIVCK